MTQPSHLDPASFFLEGGPVGMLLIHGFTGSPPEMRQVGEFLHQQGLTVSAPLLPGHGTTLEDLNRRRWTEWADHVEQALAELQARCETVFVGGLSLGSLLTLNLAARHPELPGVILYSPAVRIANPLITLTPLIKHLLPIVRPSRESDLADSQAEQHIWCYDGYPVAAAHEVLKLMRRVRRMLPEVTVPLLIIHSVLDTAIHPQSAQIAYQQAGSSDKEQITLHNSGHCLTVDSEWKSVAAKTARFVLDRSGREGQAGI